MDIVSQILTPLVDKFKMKNPVVFAVIIIILLVGSYTIEAVAEQQVCEMVDGVEVCRNLISEGAASALDKVKWVFLTLVGLLGAHTPATGKSAIAGKSKE